MSRKIFMVILYLISVFGALAQDIEVKTFELPEKGQIEALNPRIVINGNVCGLVKVALKGPGAELECSVNEIKLICKYYLL